MTTLASAAPGLLAVAAALNATASLAHVGVVIGGPSWYRFFGAGEGMARMASSGSWYPPLITLAIAAVLALWTLYALSAAGAIVRLPYLRAVLVAVTAIYLLRGVAGFALAALAPGGNSPAFWLWSSGICLVLGAVHALGLAGQWPLLSAARA